MKDIILTGLRANNDLHIGNYLGALLPLIDMARQKAGDYRVQLFVPDLHSFTTPVDHGSLQSAIMENLRNYAALGLPIEHDDVYIYRQSYIPAHSELTWILSCFTGFGEMSRMTQFKDKVNTISSTEWYSDYYSNPKYSNKNYESPNEYLKEKFQEKKDSVSVGLFSYPILMSADILLYGAEYVPVGDDQTQHLEFTRDIGQRMNAKFAQQLFRLPREANEQHRFFGKDQGLRIRDLAEPTKKMSKSAETGKGVIFLNDTPDSARKKILSATTDSYGEIRHDYAVRPGISNLLDILALFGGDKDDFIGQTQYGPLKTAVADVVTDFLQKHQQQLAQVDETTIVTALERSEEQLRQTANDTLYRVQQAVGLRPR